MTVTNYYGTPAPIFSEFLTALSAHGWTVATDTGTSGPAIYSGTRACLLHATTGATQWVAWYRGKVETDFYSGGKPYTSRITVTADDPGAGAARWAKGPGVRAIEAHRVAVSDQAKREREAASLQAARQSLIGALTARGHDAVLASRTDSVVAYTSSLASVAASFRSDGSSATLNVGWVSASDIRGVATLMLTIADHLERG